MARPPLRPLMLPRTQFTPKKFIAKTPRQAVRFWLPVNTAYVIQSPAGEHFFRPESSTWLYSLASRRPKRNLATIRIAQERSAVITTNTVISLTLASNDTLRQFNMQKKKQCLKAVHIGLLKVRRLGQAAGSPSRCRAGGGCRQRARPAGGGVSARRHAGARRPTTGSGAAGGRSPPAPDRRPASRRTPALAHHKAASQSAVTVSGMSPRSVTECSDVILPMLPYSRHVAIQLFGESIQLTFKKSDSIRFTIQKLS